MNVDKLLAVGALLDDRHLIIRSACTKEAILKSRNDYKIGRCDTYQTRFRVLYHMNPAFQAQDPQTVERYGLGEFRTISGNFLTNQENKPPVAIAINSISTPPTHRIAGKSTRNCLVFMKCSFFHHNHVHFPIYFHECTTLQQFYFYKM